MKEPLAPIALFVYKRPAHTLKTLESLARNDGAGASSLHVFCDGPKSEADRPAVAEVRRLVGERNWCGQVHVVEQATNQGLANSIIRGVTELVKRFGSVIVLEDDLVLAPHFLNFMNDGLARYRRETRVMNISGYMFPAHVPTERDACFLPICSSWGWATWARAWRHFDPDMKDFDRLAQDPFLRYRFDVDGTYTFFRMLEHQHQGKLDSWAVRWYLSAFMSGGLTLFPTRSLIRNAGFDGSGIHCGASNAYDTALYPGRLRTFPEKIALSLPAFEALKDYYRAMRPRPGVLSGFKRIAKSLRRRIAG